LAGPVITSKWKFSIDDFPRGRKITTDQNKSGNVSFPFGEGPLSPAKIFPSLIYFSPVRKIITSKRMFSIDHFPRGMKITTNQNMPGNVSFPLGEGLLSPAKIFPSLICFSTAGMIITSKRK